MSSTNHTANYNLPQFVGSDKPTWLGDVNQAMSIIDGQMKTNANNITSASGEVTELETRVQTAEGTVSDLSTAVTTVQNQANATDGAVNSLTTTVNSLVSKLSLGTATSATGASIISALGSGITGSGTLYLSQSTDGSVFKFYGGLTLTRSSSSTGSVTLQAIPGLTGYYGVPTGLTLATPPSEAFRIVGSGYAHYIDQSGTGVVRNTYASNIAVASTGQIYVSAQDTAKLNQTGQTQTRVWYPANLYFNSNFGDVDSE